MAWWETNNAIVNRIERKQDHVLDLLHQVLENQESLMSALTDLQASLAALTTAVSGLTTSVASGVAEIETLLGKIAAPGTSDADVEAAVAQIGTITAAIGAQAKAVDDEVAKAAPAPAPPA